MIINNCWKLSRRRLESLLVVPAILLSVSAAEGSVARAIPFETKVQSAESIVQGRCIRTESRMDPSGKWILTHSTFEVSNSFKGEAAKQITVVTPGGKVGALHQETIGVPRFESGQERVLFVKAQQTGPSILYFDQGTYEVVRQGNQMMVTPVASELVLVDEASGKIRDGESPRSLEQFEKAVSVALGKEGGRFNRASSLGGSGETRDVLIPLARSTGNADNLFGHFSSGAALTLVALGGALLAFLLIKRR